MIKRYLCLWLPNLSCERSARERPALRRVAFVCVEQVRHMQRIVAVSRHASASVPGHSLVGMTLTAARAVCSNLMAIDQDHRADAQAMEDLAAWAQQFGTPVSLYTESALVVEVSGSTHLFASGDSDSKAGRGRPGESAMLRTALRGLARLGYTGRGAVADTPRAAHALALGSREPSIIAPSMPSDSLTPTDWQSASTTIFHALPLRALSLDPGTLDDLSELGLKTVGEVLRLPRGTLSARFGAALTLRLAEMLGEKQELLRTHTWSKVLRERLEFDPAMVDGDGLLFSVKRLADRIAERLAGSTLGALSMILSIRFDPCRGAPPPCRLEVAAAEPQNRSRTLLSLLQIKLKSIEIPEGAHIIEMSLEVSKTGPMPHRCQSMFEPKRTLDTEGLAVLVDRLSARLGEDQVARAVLVEDWLPERSWRAVPYLSGDDAAIENAKPTRAKRPEWRDYDGSHFAPSPTVAVKPRLVSDDVMHPVRPSVLHESPLRISVRTDSGVPVAIDGVDVVASEGPERIVNGWWRRLDMLHPRPEARDYWRVLRMDGLAVWVFRGADGGWYEHGVFA